ncbi:MAG: hypothetical protein E7647_02445 [Ruminococcaceae bacterium]|nr:hypothetical protein [Oscillospiraceae bacterium]
MFKKLGMRIRILTHRVGCVPKIFLIIPALMLASALIIRLSTGGTHLIYTVLGGRGIFPGPFLYTVLYSVRLILFGIIFAFSVFSFRVYDERLRTVLPCVLSAIMLLLEYKLIFGGVSLILAIAFSVLCGFFAVVSIVTARIKYRSVSVVMLIFALLQLIHFIQLISLSVCI